MKKIRSLLKIFIVSLIVVGVMFAGMTLYATNISRALHPNLAEAQNMIERAIAKVSAAQSANEFDMKGHAAKAKSLLDQAYNEIKLAALAANK
jgi:hypothetical protein